jgi:hypothetical protein
VVKVLDGDGRRARQGACAFLLFLKLGQELAHGHLPEGDWNAINTNLDPRSEALGLKVVLCS